MEAQAIWKYARISPRKMRLIADVIRGKEVNAAMDIVRFTNKKAAEMMEKILKSALSNVQNKSEAGVDLDGMVVKEIFVDGGPMLKRFRPRAMGRAFRIRKRTSHITIVVGTK